MENTNNVDVIPKSINILDAIKIARSDSMVIALLNQDSQAEIYHHLLQKPEIEALNAEFPNLLPTKNDFVFSINVISSKLSNQHSYKKIRLYIDAEGRIINRFEN